MKNLYDKMNICQNYKYVQSGAVIDLLRLKVGVNIITNIGIEMAIQLKFKEYILMMKNDFGQKLKRLADAGSGLVLLWEKDMARFLSAAKRFMPIGLLMNYWSAKFLKDWLLTIFAVNPIALIQDTWNQLLFGRTLSEATRGLGKGTGKTVALVINILKQIHISIRIIRREYVGLVLQDVEIKVRKFNTP